MEAAGPLGRAALRPRGDALARRIGWLERAALVLVCLVLWAPGLASLPPIDRDEARFAQATRQMLESGDLVDIRFQDEPRHKKPAGIHWLQAASVALLSAPEAAAVWPYRLASLAGAIAAVLLTAQLGCLLFGREAGLLAGAILAGTLLLGIEARLAKTDAVLLACICGVALALARARADAAGPGWGAPLGLALPLALGVLVKGPVILLVAGALLAALLAVERDLGWLRRLKPGRAALVALALVAPWLVAIGLATEGAFFAEALGRDFLGKAVAGQESHGAPPGTHLLALPLTFWPFTLLATFALPWVWRRRRQPAVRFCLAWIVPAWLLFELVPTKLPHYVLPVFPALALLTAAAVADGAEAWRGRARRLAGWLVGGWLLLAVLVAAAPAALLWGLEGRLSGLGTLAALALIGAAGLAARWALAGRLRPAAAALLGGLLVFHPVAFGQVLPGLRTLWVAPRVAAAVAAESGCPQPVVAAAGFHEPSLVFALGTATRLVDAAGAAAHLAGGPCALALVEARAETAFQEALAAAGRSARPLAEIDGLNLSKGDRLHLTLYGPAPGG